MRALRNIGGSRFAPGNSFKIGLTGFGPNINIVRDPRFGRNRSGGLSLAQGFMLVMFERSELPGEDPVLSGECDSLFFQPRSGIEFKQVRRRLRRGHAGA